MKRLLLLCVLAAFAVAASAADQSTVNKELTKATHIIGEMTGANATAGIPASILESAKCIAVVPDLLRAGFVVGGEHGDGVATCRTANNRWSPPAPFKVTGGSFGPQIGGSATDLIMMMNQQGMDGLLKGHFKVGADASAAAGPVGRDASASAGWKAGILTYSRSKGAYVGVSVNGAELQQDDGATKVLYGHEVNFANILNGSVPTPNTAMAQDFVRSVERAEQSARR